MDSGRVLAVRAAATEQANAEWRSSARDVPARAVARAAARGGESGGDRGTGEGRGGEARGRAKAAAPDGAGECGAGEGPDKFDGDARGNAEHGGAGDEEREERRAYVGVFVEAGLPTEVAGHLGVAGVVVAVGEDLFVG